MSQYATKSDLTSFGVNALALAGVTGLTDPVIDACLQAASSDMDSYFKGRYNLPLLDWDNSVRMKCCWMAAWLIMAKTRGFNPDNPSDVTIRTSYEDAVKWCEGVQRQSIHPTVTETPGASATYQLPQVSTLPPRGWGNGGPP